MLLGWMNVPWEHGLNIQVFNHDASLDVLLQFISDSECAFTV